MTTSHGRLAVLSAALLLGCAPAAPDLEAEGRALMQVSRDWSDQVKDGKIEEALAVWADDAVLMAPGLPPLEGKAAIKQYVESAMHLPGFAIRWEPTRVHVARSGELAYMIERNEITAPNAAGKLVTSYGKVVTVWRKDAGGTWKNVVDMWNEAPPPGS
ncbi:MAG: DUF4440 domain-containing protein [Gemmatimonadaceae bacterium]